MTLTPTYLILSVYVLALVIITLLAIKKEKAEDFLIASHDLGWKSIGMSTFATLISSYNIVLGLTFAFLLGPYLVIIFSGAIFAFVGVYFISKNNRDLFLRKNFINVVDYLDYKFGSRAATIFNLTLIFILFFFIVLQFYVNTFVFSNLLGWNKYLSSIFVALIVLGYTFFGGFRTDVKTDIFQGIFMLALVSLIFFVDKSAITSEIVYQSFANKTIFFSTLGLTVMQFLTMLIQPELWQRVYAARSNKDLKKGLALAFVLLLFILIPEVIIGLAVKASGQVTDSGNVFYEVMKFASPDWFFPFVVVALFAAFMSTLDSSLFAISSQLGKQGFIVGNKDEFDESKIKQKSKRAMIFVTLGALIFSLFLSNFLNSVFQLLSVATVTSTVVIMAMLLKATEKEIIAGLILGIVSFIYMSLSGIITQEVITSLYPTMLVAVYMIVQKIAVSVYGKGERK